MSAPPNLLYLYFMFTSLFHNESMHKKSKNIFWTLTIFFDWAIITVQDTTTKDNVNLIARVLPWHVT